MSTQTWRILAFIFLAIALVLAIVAVVLFRVMRIRQVRDVLTGRSEAEEIERMRSARAGTWGMADFQKSGPAGHNESEESNRREPTHSSTQPVEFMVHSVDTPPEPVSQASIASDWDLDEGSTSLMGNGLTPSGDADDEAKTTLAGRS